MKKVKVCDCNPDAHKVTTTDLKLLRRVRRNMLADAARWEAEGCVGVADCARYTAYQCLARIRELKKGLGVVAPSIGG